MYKRLHEEIESGPEEKPKRNPYCSRCRNHGKSAQVKGHKRHCEYRYCQCEGCRLVECRQIVSAAQIKRRRYQKQDEECGRRVEITPPMLTRAPNNDPATLIAKTLTGSLKQGGSSKQLDIAVGGGSMSQAHLQTQIQNQLQNQMIGWPPFKSSPGTSLSDALHLFQFTAAFSQQQANPSNLLIAGGGGGTGVGLGGGGGGGCGPSGGLDNPLLSSSSFPDMREQLSMVEEINQSFGPLAIFTWIRKENFNMSKVRAQIEMARVAYDLLLQLNGQSALDLTSPLVDI